MLRERRAKSLFKSDPNNQAKANVDGVRVTLTKVTADSVVTWQAATLAGDMMALFILSRALTYLVTVLPICAWQTS